jgi:hypothetical protein
VSEEQLPKRFGRYTLHELLGEGGMARVHLALKDGAVDPCVLKLLLPDVASQDIALKRFHREAHLASYLDHPRIARLLDAGFEENRFYLATELIVGLDLEHIAQALAAKGRLLPYSISLHVILGVLEGIAYAHDAKDPSGKPLDLVHRDLSPRNMMLGFEGDPKVIDFGLARGKLDDFKTAPGMVMGTLRYISPEQALAEVPDKRSDLYTIAVVLHELLTGWVMVKPASAMDVLRSVVHEKAPLVSEVNPALPKALDPVIERALAKSAADRWPSASELAASLRTAAAPLLDVTRDQIAAFMCEHFPLERERAERFRALRRDDAQSGTKTRTFVRPEPVEIERIEEKTGLTFPAHPPRAAIRRAKRRELWRGRVQGALVAIAIGVAALVAIRSMTNEIPATAPVVVDAPVVVAKAQRPQAPEPVEAVAKPEPTPPRKKPAKSAPEESPPSPVPARSSSPALVELEAITASMIATNEANLAHTKEFVSFMKRLSSIAEALDPEPKKRILSKRDRIERSAELHEDEARDLLSQVREALAASGAHSP